MRPFIPAASVLALAMAACADNTTGSVDDGGADHVAVEDTAMPDDVEVPDDTGDVAEDVAEEGDCFTCPDVTPGDVTLAHEQPTLISVDISSPEAASASIALCRYEPPFAWATRLAEDGSCRVLNWLPVETLPTGTNLDTGDVRIDVGGTVLTVAPAGGSLPCYRPTSGGPLGSVAAGTAVRVWSTGGGDVPAFDLTTTVPALPTVTEPLEGATLTACLPWTVAWTVEDVSDVRVQFRSLLPDDTDFALSCRDLTISPLVIPAALTTLWPATIDRTHCEVRAVNRVVSTTDPVVTLEVTHGTLLAPPVTVEHP